MTRRAVAIALVSLLLLLALCAWAIRSELRPIGPKVEKPKVERMR